jgi:serine/threonine-protein kinase HipA
MALILCAFIPRRESHPIEDEWVEHRRIFAPAYDLTFSYGPGGEESMLVMGEGRNPGTAQLQALGNQHGVMNAPEILEKVRGAVANWARFVEQAEVSRRSAKEVATKINL